MVSGGFGQNVVASMGSASLRVQVDRQRRRRRTQAARLDAPALSEVAEASMVSARRRPSGRPAAIFLANGSTVPGAARGRSLDISRPADLRAVKPPVRAMSDALLLGDRMVRAWSARRPLPENDRRPRQRVGCRRGPFGLSCASRRASARGAQAGQRDLVDQPARCRQRRRSGRSSRSAMPTLPVLKSPPPQASSTPSPSWSLLRSPSAGPVRLNAASGRPSPRPAPRRAGEP